MQFLTKTPRRSRAMQCNLLIIEKNGADSLSLKGQHHCSVLIIPIIEPSWKATSKGTSSSPPPPKTSYPAALSQIHVGGQMHTSSNKCPSLICLGFPVTRSLDVCRAVRCLPNIQPQPRLLPQQCTSSIHAMPHTHQIICHSSTEIINGGGEAELHRDRLVPKRSAQGTFVIALLNSQPQMWRKAPRRRSPGASAFSVPVAARDAGTFPFLQMLPSRFTAAASGGERAVGSAAGEPKQSGGLCAGEGLPA